jgi:hypothetical protein
MKHPSLPSASPRLYALATTVLLTATLALRANPVAYWSFDSDFSATIGGSVFDGVPVNNASIDTVQSRFGGGALHLSRASSQYVQVPASPFSQGSYTYAAWYYLDVPAVSVRYFVLEASNGSTFPASYGLRLLDGVQSGQVFTSDDSTIGSASVAFASGPNQQWRHIAVTFDAGSKGFGIYLDGVDLGLTMALSSDATMISPSTFLVIGGHRAGTGRNWEGWIDDLAVWDRVLSPAEIASLQTNPVPEPRATTLLVGLAAAMLLLWRRRARDH